MSKAAARRATFLPILPSPTMPSVLPRQLVDPLVVRSPPTRHLPATTSLWKRTTRLSTASISMIVCSATAMALAPPLLDTGTPALRAASMSTRS